MFVIYFNGPPGSGKDTLAELISRRGVKEFTAVRHKLRHHVDDVAAQIIGVDIDIWRKIMDDRDKKDKPRALCPRRSNIPGYAYDPADDRHLSPREWNIWVAENLMKPLFGPQIFGMREASALMRIGDKHLVMYTDAGFKDELRPLSTCTDIRNQAIVRLHRDGTSYTGDSRSYLPDDFLGMTVIDHDNNAPLVMSGMTLISSLMTHLPGLAPYLTINRLLGVPIDG